MGKNEGYHVLEIIKTAAREYFDAEQEQERLELELDSACRKKLNYRWLLMRVLKRYEKEVGVPYIAIDKGRVAYLDTSADDGSEVLASGTLEAVLTTLRYRELSYRARCKSHKLDRHKVEQEADAFMLQESELAEHKVRIFGNADKASEQKRVEEAKEQPKPKR